MNLENLTHSLAEIPLPALATLFFWYSFPKDSPNIFVTWLYFPDCPLQLLNVSCNKIATNCLMTRLVFCQEKEMLLLTSWNFTSVANEIKFEYKQPHTSHPHLHCCAITSTGPYRSNTFSQIKFVNIQFLVLFYQMWRGLFYQSREQGSPNGKVCTAMTSSQQFLVRLLLQILQAVVGQETSEITN